MTARDFLTNVAVILTVMAGGALLETLVPMFAARPWTQGRRMANLGLTALSFGSNWLLASLAALAALTLRPAGLLAQLGWPLSIEIGSASSCSISRSATCRIERCTCGRRCGASIKSITVIRSST